MSFLGSLFTGLLSTGLGMMGGGGNDASLAAQDQANKLRVTAQALSEASKEKAKADEQNIFTERDSAINQQQALQGLIANFRNTLLGGGR